MAVACAIGMQSEVIRSILERERAAQRLLDTLRAAGVCVTSDRGEEWILAVMRIALDDDRKTWP